MTTTTLALLPDFLDPLTLLGYFGTWALVGLLVVVFIESGVLFPVLPGDSLLFIAGAVAAGGGMDPVLLAGLLMLAAIMGDSTNYVIGRTAGERLFSNPNSKIFRRDYLQKTHDFYEKHGGKTVTLARFLPILRTIAPFVAGMGAMHYKRFIVFNFVGGFLWVVAFLYAGHFFGNMPAVKQNFSILMIGIIVISLLPMLIGTVRHRMKRAQA